MSVVDIVMHFLGIFNVYKFDFVIWCFFIMKSTRPSTYHNNSMAILVSCFTVIVPNEIW